MLQQGTRDFSIFWAKFLRFSQELDYSKATLIDDLIKKCNYTIQEKLAIGEENFTDLLKLAKCYQRIEFAIKSLEQNNGLYERELAQRNNRLVSQSKIIVDSPGSSAALAQGNSNLTTPLRMAQILKSHVQAAASPRLPT